MGCNVPSGRTREQVGEIHSGQEQVGCGSARDEPISQYIEKHLCRRLVRWRIQGRDAEGFPEKVNNCGWLTVLLQQR